MLSAVGAKHLNAASARRGRRGERFFGRKSGLRMRVLGRLAMYVVLEQR
jgi:hypothetical protein